MSRLASRIGIVRKRFKVIPDWRNAGLGGIATFREVAVEIQVYRINVVGARLSGVPGGKKGWVGAEFSVGCGKVL